VVGVLGAGGTLTFFGDALGATDVFAVDIAAGRLVVLFVVGFSTGFAGAAGFELPFALPFTAPPGFVALLTDASIFLVSSFGFPAFGASRFPPPSCFSTSFIGVSTAVSGMTSSITALFFRARSSVAIDSFVCAVATGSSCSWTLKLSLLFDMLGSPLSSFLA
jgi:hypothetical protein